MDDDYKKAYKAFRWAFNAFLVVLAILAIGVAVAVAQEVFK